MGEPLPTEADVVTRLGARDLAMSGPTYNGHSWRVTVTKDTRDITLTISDGITGNRAAQALQASHTRAGTSAQSSCLYAWTHTHMHNAWSRGRGKHLNNNLPSLTLTAYSYSMFPLLLLRAGGCCSLPSARLP